MNAMVPRMPHIQLLTNCFPAVLWILDESQRIKFAFLKCKDEWVDVPLACAVLDQMAT